MPATHQVSNQVPPLVGHDPIGGDAALAEACIRHADAATLASLGELGRIAGSEQAQEWGATKTRRSWAPATGTAAGSTRWSPTRTGTT